MIGFSMIGLDYSILDFAGESYSQVMAIVNFVCFGAFIFCATYIFVMAALGQFQAKPYKYFFFSSFLVLIVLLIIHFGLLETYGIPLLVPPVGTPYFTEFIHVMQYVASVAVVILGALVFVTAALTRIDPGFQKGVVSTLSVLVILLVIDYYIQDNFGIKLIFPPNLW